jgi:hypothetical protein
MKREDALKKLNLQLSDPSISKIQRILIRKER